jgi:Domain of unknown function (DUF222)
VVDPNAATTAVTPDRWSWPSPSSPDMRSSRPTKEPLLLEIAEYAQAESWRGEGFLSMEAWLIGHCRMSAARAKTLVSTARRTADLPALAGVLTDGRLTLDVVAPIAAVATPENEATLSEKASQWTPKQARQAAADLRGATKADSAASFGRRCVRFNEDRHSFWAQLTPDSYALVKSALVGRARRHDHPSANDPDYSAFESRCADALTELCAGPANGATRSKDRGSSKPGRQAPDCTGGARSPGPQASMVVHVDLERLLHGDRYGEAAIEWVGPISADVARRLACNAKITMSFESPGGTVLDQKPLDRIPPFAQRIAVRRRDVGCRCCGTRNLTDVSPRVARRRRWSDGALQPHHFVRSPPQSGARTGLDGGGRRPGRGQVHQPALPGSQIHPGPTLGGGTGMTPGRQAGATTFRCLTSSGRLA